MAFLWGNMQDAIDIITSEFGELDALPALGLEEKHIGAYIVSGSTAELTRDAYVTAMNKTNEAPAKIV